jgi:membrane-bound lytic murein transglycosylase MltF
MRFAALGIGSVLVLSAVATFTGCGGDKPAAPAEPPPVATPVEEAETPLPPSELETRLPAAVLEGLLRPATGDLDEMVKRRAVRVGVTFNRTFYFVDKGVQRGVSYDYGQLVEERLNEHFKTKPANRIHVVFVPLPREMLLPALVDGKVDLVAAQLTVRPELEKHVDFTNATRTNVSQILVTGPSAPAIASVDDLSGKTVFAREGSTYHENLTVVSKRLETEGKPPIDVAAVPMSLEDDDVLEMVNAGLIPAIVVDDYLAKFWKKVLPNIVVHENVAVHAGGTLAVAVRKNNPQLVAALNTFLGNYGLGTSFGTQVERKYLESTKYAKNATSEASRKKFQAVVDLFRKYGEKYEVDFLLMAAQGYQESQLDHRARSHVGAVGIMQVMPATGRELKVGDIRQLEPNIHAGVKYMRKTIDTYFKDEPMDDLNKGLFAFAAYNAGPGRVRQLRELAAKRGLDPNVWFGNVEQIASERIGRETVTYVANIYKYYIAYRLILEENERKTAAKEAVKAAGGR